MMTSLSLLTLSTTATNELNSSLPLKSIAIATFLKDGFPCSINSTNLGNNTGGRLSTQKYPMSSKH
ncbi:Uncharacterised protein [Staphylococcus aureus]|nr:Uncharacterised protein [Staphylococcus aureus]